MYYSVYVLVVSVWLYGQPWKKLRAVVHSLQFATEREFNVWHFLNEIAW
jgi:hypothetical protein